ncbi:MAG: hypothetical protein V4631_22100 [Pseudomonadota bacterium]
MPTTPAVLFEAKLAEGADTLQYSSDNCTTAIDKLTATNVTAGIVTITAYLVAPGGAVGALNTITITKSVAPGIPYLFPEIVGHILAIGGSIWTKASAAASIAIRGSGRKTT